MADDDYQSEVQSVNWAQRLLGNLAGAATGWAAGRFLEKAFGFPKFDSPILPSDPAKSIAIVGGVNTALDMARAAADDVRNGSYSKGKKAESGIAGDQPPSQAVPKPIPYPEAQSNAAPHLQENKTQADRPNRSPEIDGVKKKSDSALDELDRELEGMRRSPQQNRTEPEFKNPRPSPSVPNNQAPETRDTGANDVKRRAESAFDELDGELKGLRKEQIREPERSELDFRNSRPVAMPEPKITPLVIDGMEAKPAPMPEPKNKPLIIDGIEVKPAPMPEFSKSTPIQSNFGVEPIANVLSLKEDPFAPRRQAILDRAQKEGLQDRDPALYKQLEQQVLAGDEKYIKGAEKMLGIEPPVKVSEQDPLAPRRQAILDKLQELKIDTKEPELYKRIEQGLPSAGLFKLKELESTWGVQRPQMQNSGPVDSNGIRDRSDKAFEQFDQKLEKKRALEKEQPEKAETIKREMLDKMEKSGVPEPIRDRAAKAYDRATTDGQPLQNLKGIAGIMSNGDEAAIKRVEDANAKFESDPVIQYQEKAKQFRNDSQNMEGSQRFDTFTKSGLQCDVNCKEAFDKVASGIPPEPEPMKPDVQRDMNTTSKVSAPGLGA